MKVWNLVSKYKDSSDVTFNLRDKNGSLLYYGRIQYFLKSQPIEMWDKELKRFTIIPQKNGMKLIVAQTKA